MCVTLGQFIRSTLNLEEPKMEITLRIPGAVKAFTFVHLTDVHLSECDDRNEDLILFMAKRDERFGRPTKIAWELFRKANSYHPDFVAVTGDMVDVPTQACLETAGNLLQSLEAPFFFCVGNHEWGNRVTPPDRAHWRNELRAWTPQPMDWFVQRWQGVNLLFVDDSDYQITPEQLKRTSELLETGRPCLLFMHIPIVIESLIEPTRAKWKSPILIGAAHGEGVQPSTAAFCELVKKSPQVKAIFTGHIHFDHVDEYRENVHQYVTAPAFESVLRRVRVEPA